MTLASFLNARAKIGLINQLNVGAYFTELTGFKITLVLACFYDDTPMTNPIIYCNILGNGDSSC